MPAAPRCPPTYDGGAGYFQASMGTVPPASELIRRQCGRAPSARAPPYLPQRSNELDSVAPIVGCAKEGSRVPRAPRANAASEDSELAHSACLLNDATYCLAVPLVARRDKVVRSVRPVTIVAQGAHLHERRHVAGEYIKFKFPTHPLPIFFLRNVRRPRGPCSREQSPPPPSSLGGRAGARPSRAPPPTCRSVPTSSTPSLPSLVAQKRTRGFRGHCAPTSQARIPSLRIRLAC